MLILGDARLLPLDLLLLEQLVAFAEVTEQAPVLHLELGGAHGGVLCFVLDDHAHGVGDDMGGELPALLRQRYHELELEVLVERQRLGFGQLALIACVMEVVGEDSEGEL